MASLTELSIRRPVAIAMAYLIAIIIGIVGLLYLPVDLLPQIEFPRLSVIVDYPNVGPEEMETIVTDPLENALSGIPNLERMTSRSEEGRSRVSLWFGRGTDINEAANDVRAALDRLRDALPREAERPSIFKFDPDAQSIVTLSVVSKLDLASATRLLEREIAQRFEQIPGVGAITVGGGVYREIQVQLLRDRLRAAGLTVNDVSDALARENVQLPGGNVRDGISDLYVRTLGEYRSLDEIGGTVITVREGSPIRVRDVARVVDGYQEPTNLVERNGVPMIRLDIQKQSGANTVAVAERIREEVAFINAMRSDISLAVEQDQSVFIRQSMANVQNSALWGGLLAIAVLYLFLRNGSTTAIVAMAIPISITATFGLLYFTGLTLNQMTFGGLALGIGLMVDSAIVVLENIVRHRQREGRSLADSALVGTREVAGAVVASTLTTCVIFLPVVFMRTTSGQLFQTLAMVVVFALACSLLIALTLVPVLASRFLTVRPPTGDAPSGGRKGALLRLEAAYSRWLEHALARPRRVFGATAALLVGALLLWPMIDVELTPQIDTDVINVELDMARGTSIAVAKEYVDELRSVISAAVPSSEVESILTWVRRDGDADVNIRLAPAHLRTMAPSDLADELRDVTVGRIPGGEIRVQAQSGMWMLRRLFSAGGRADAIEIELRGYDLGEARRIAADMGALIAQVEGVVEVVAGEREGRPEENLVFHRDRIYDLGLSVQEVARSVQTSVGGSRAGYFRETGEQFPIVVRLRPEDRLTVQDLESISVRTPQAEMIPVSFLVQRQRDRGPSEIEHIDGQRVLYISAALKSGVALGDAVSRIQERLNTYQLPQGFSIVFGGAFREQQQAQRDFFIAICLAIALVYMVMAGQFERFLDPLVVMFSVPVALVGVVPTLLVTGTTINVQSIMGMVMLIGIVVNNAIVLVDYMNLKRRADGLNVRDAAILAARTRLRPVLMTTTTTVLALLPLALGLGEGSGLQAPLARVVVGGLLASTLVTLFLIPTLYVTATEKAARARAALDQFITSRRSVDEAQAPGV